MRVVLVVYLIVLSTLNCSSLFAGGAGADPEFYPLPCTNTITASVVALDQPIFYNRFGAFDPAGMMFALERNVEPELGATVTPGDVRLKTDIRPRPLTLRVNEGDCIQVTLTNLLDPFLFTDIRTRSVSMNAAGMELAQGSMSISSIGQNPSAPVQPGESATFTWYAAKRGSYAINSLVSSSGGEGSGGSQGHGLFGAIIVEPAGSTWYRSQVHSSVLAAATTGQNPNGTPIIDYNATHPDGTPVLRILNDNNELIYSDLNAIISGFAGPPPTESRPPSGTSGEWYREFTVIFHDDVAIMQAYPELENDSLFKGVRDGFAINYGCAGMGAEIIAVRRGEGPGKDCGECKFEEFFLESWVNGDPAMPTLKDVITGQATQEQFPHDPSNVHHSYVGDPVRFENIHIGSSTHVFHLHAHQWLFAPNDENSTYLDSQSISPGTSYSYEINYGGGGNRNLMPGDSIFHCHLYPHFAQGMWELWRTHDVFENGQPGRNLPDYEIAGGTSNPAIVPIPGLIQPPMPSPAHQGYPFFIAGTAGRRSPQPPFDVEHDGGLPRHYVQNATVTDGPLAIADHYSSDPVHQRVAAGGFNPNAVGFARRIDSAELQFLPATGTPEEATAMDFHAGLLNPNPELGPAVSMVTEHGWPAVGYPSFDSAGTSGHFLVNGLPPQPGAPYSDPCPPTFVAGDGSVRSTPERTYQAAYIQFDMTINQLGWHDRQARIAVLNEDVFPTLDGTRTPQPLIFRANSGDCVVYKATNLMPNNLNLDDYQIFTPTDIIGQHIHLVKFDVTSSDGAGNGWNYEDGTFSPEEVRERIAAHNQFVDPNSDGVVDVAGATLLSPEVHPFYGPGPSDAWVGAQTTIQRWWADPLINNAGEDRTIRTVFTHDHFAPSSHQQHGLYALLVVEPTDSTWTLPDGTPMATRVDGGPTNWAANILNGLNSTREFVFETGDLMPTYDEFNLPVEAHGGLNNPEAISTGGGSVTINYRNQPLTPTLTDADAQLFSTLSNGEPNSFIGNAYPGDPISIRLAHGANAEQHSFGVQGARWLQEPSNPNSGFTNMQQYGISEHFEMEFVLGDGLLHTTTTNEKTDFLTGSLTGPDLLGGMWGIIRSHHASQPTLQPLPNNSDWSNRASHPLSLGFCPTGPDAPPKRTFEIEAWRAEELAGAPGMVLSEKFGWHDPNALVFVHADQVPDIMSGIRRIEPLVMRVNAGDCIEVTLRNMLPPILPALPGSVTGSTRVGLQPQLLSYDMGISAGSSVGRNPDTLVGAGEVRQFAWYAGEIKSDISGVVTWTPVEYGVTNLRSMGDQDGHYTHGLYGVCVVEPEGSVWVDVETGVAQKGGFQADLFDANGELLYREFVLQLMNSMPQVKRQNGLLIEGSTLKNFEGVNYCTEPLWARLGVTNPSPWVQMSALDQTNALSSVEPLFGCGGLPCGDPATPLCEVNAGTPVMFRVSQAAGQVFSPRSFTISNHNWQTQPWIDGSTKIGFNPTSSTSGTVGNIAAGSHLNLYTIAGGAARASGDYLYRSHSNFAFSGGCWGIFRVNPYARVPAQPVGNLTCTGGLDGVELSWTNTGDDYLGIEVYRGGVLIANLPPQTTNFSDLGLPSGSYQYEVITFNAELPSTPVTCNAQVAPPSATNLTCQANATIVTLNWSLPSVPGGFDSILIHRNGTLIASLPGALTTFHDTEAGVGPQSWDVTCIIAGVASDSIGCSATVLPAPVSSLGAILENQCNGLMTASWTNNSPYEFITVFINGGFFGSLPGNATSVGFAITPGSSSEICLVGTVLGLETTPTCATFAVPVVSASPVGNLTCVDNPIALTTDLSWTNTSQYSSLEVSLNGFSVLTLSGNATNATVSTGYGTHTIEVLGSSICGEPIPTTSCTVTFTPPPITNLSVNVVDPCTCIMSASWSSPVVYDTITVLLNGLPIAILDGTATLVPFSLPAANSQLCVVGTIGGVDSLASCVLADCDGINTSGVTQVTCSVDPVSLSLHVSWQNNGDYSVLQVAAAGQILATVPGTTSSATVPLPASGTFDVCITGTTLCGDPIPSSCCTASAPVTFIRGDVNGDMMLDISDVSSTLAVIFNGNASLCYDAHDSNDDGKIDVSDPITVLLFLFAGGSPPQGNGSCIADVTSDGLTCDNHIGCP